MFYYSIGELWQVILLTQKSLLSKALTMGDGGEEDF